MANKTTRWMKKMNGFMFFEPDLQLIFYVKYETKAEGDGDGMREWECLGFLYLQRSYLYMHDTDEYRICVHSKVIHMYTYVRIYIG